ncbi:unnamed protein product [Heligmosomoides polygyrus]|uniref:ETS domain-containing protein n=1 Tax=Heligmosomoides polygyrus TaxID=6339 RepID=A0A3P8D620_HELPZ|nr:unnamed protein product [Heligmosomoides polygyrus]
MEAPVSTPSRWTSTGRFHERIHCGNILTLSAFRDLILRHLIQDISTTCAKLGLPTDAQNWTQEHGSRWISEMCQQFSLTPPRQTYLSGRVLLSMTQKDFVALAPEGGDTLYAQLQLWKTGRESFLWKKNMMNGVTDKERLRNYPNDAQQNQCAVAGGATDAHNFFGNGILPSPSDSDRSSNASMHDREFIADLTLCFVLTAFHDRSYQTPPSEEQRPSPFPRHSGTVHLWHFIRELLDHPNKQYGSCVRWVDRDEGTFKIESSHHLARFWGQRKNRAQMNYDKLSRSLRQYYKKAPKKKLRHAFFYLIASRISVCVELSPINDFFIPLLCFNTNYTIQISPQF